MTQTQNVFRRVEKKYLLTAEQYHILMARLPDFGMETDAFGKHTISNIYYDTKDYALIRASLEKPTYKEKLRLRAYGVPTEASPAFVEIKKKCKGVVYKRRVEMPLASCAQSLALSRMPDSCGQIGREITYMMTRYALEPKVMLAYDREALFSREDQELRITFDQDIRFRQDELSLTSGSTGWLILPRGRRLMEIKLVNAMPLWLVRLLEQHGIRETSFSKYGMVYSQYLMNELQKEWKQSA